MFFFFSSRRRHTRSYGDWSSDVCSSDLENQQRAVLVEIHREAQTFFVKQLEGTLEGKAARAYLEDRGLDKDTVERFGIGYAPSGGDLLLRHLRGKYPEKTLVESGLV